MGQTGGKGGLESKITGQLDQLEALIVLRFFPDEQRGAIATTVVDEHRTPAARRLAVKEGRQPRAQFGQHGFFVEDRDDDSDGRG